MRATSRPSKQRVEAVATDWSTLSRTVAEEQELEEEKPEMAAARTAGFCAVSTLAAALTRATLRRWCACSPSPLSSACSLVTSFSPHLSSPPHSSPAPYQVRVLSPYPPYPPYPPYQVRVLPLASCVVVFWMVYSQMSSNFQLQGCKTRTVGLRSPHVGPNADLNGFSS